jgi:hypothetical protein
LRRHTDSDTDQYPFAACDFNIDSKKHAPFKSYFWDEFLIAEQQKSCDYHEGEYDPETRECTVAVSYRYLTAGIKTTGGGCGQSRTLSVKLGGRPLPCTRERFAIAECNMIDEAIENQRKNQEMMGWVSLGTGILGATVGAISAGTGKMKDTEITRLETQKAEYECPLGVGTNCTVAVAQDNTLGWQNKLDSVNEKLEKNSNINNTGAKIEKAWEMGNAGLTQGATGLLAASILDSTGRLVTGKCTTADGIEVLEPNTIFLDW